MSAIKRYVSTLVDLVKREPIRTFAVLRSLGLVILAFAPGLVSAEQSAAILTLAATWFGVDEVVRQQTTPVSAPTLPEGTDVTVATPAGEADRTVTL
jgi:hypothetical protein